MMPLIQVCLVVFLATTGTFIYQAQTGADYSLAFLMMGATGCLYLLLRLEQRYTRLTRYREMPARPDHSKLKRSEPKVSSKVTLIERRPIPALNRAAEHKSAAASGLRHK